MSLSTVLAEQKESVYSWLREQHGLPVQMPHHIILPKEHPVVKALERMCRPINVRLTVMSDKDGRWTLVESKLL